MTDHPFPRDIVATVADEHEIARDQLDNILERIQRAIERGDGQYEYSSQHNFGWKDADAFYLYSDGMWETLGKELSFEQSQLAPARTVHHRYMIDSAKQRNEGQTIGEQLDEELEALVVANTAEGDPLFGQDV